MSGDASSPTQGSPTQVYGLDIETDTATDGLDPTVARILCVGLSGPGGGLVLAHHDEAALLRDLDAWLAELTPGVLATWNGAAFDLPYLTTRAELLGVSTKTVQRRLNRGLVLLTESLGDLRHPGA